MPVYKDEKRNSWEVKTNYKSFDGKVKWVHKRGFAKKADAQKWEAEFKSKTAGTLDMTLNSFIDLYLENIKSRIKYTTICTKTEILDKWIRPYLGSKLVNQITTLDIISWQNKLMSSTYGKNNIKFSKSYLKTIHNQLNAVLNYAKRYYKLNDNPAAIVGNMGSAKDTKMSFWTNDEYLKFRETIMDKPMYYYAFEVLYWCGIREGELFALTRNDVDLVKKTININKTLTRIKKENIITDPKTRKSKRIVSIPDFLAQELKDYFDLVYEPTEDMRLFPITKSALTITLKKGARQAGLKEIRVHDLRHSHVSLLIHLGYSPVAIGDRVGHESVYITFHYAHLFPSVQQNMADKLDEINNGGDCDE